MEVIKVNKVKKCLFIFVLLTAYICLNSCYSQEKVENYLNTFERCSGVSVTDYTNIACIDNEIIYVKNQFNEVMNNNNIKFNRLVYIENKQLYIVGRNSVSNEFHLFISDISVSSLNLVYSFKTFNEGIKMKMLNHDLFYYTYYSESYIYLLESNQVLSVNKDYDDEYSKQNKNYNIKKKVNAFSSNTTEFVIQSKYNDETKVLTIDNFLEIEQVKFLKEKSIFSLGEIYEVDGEIFIIGVSNGCSIIFKYYFELNRLEYYSWISTKNLISEYRYYYFS